MGPDIADCSALSEICRSPTLPLTPTQAATRWSPTLPLTPTPTQAATRQTPTLPLTPTLTQAATRQTPTLPLTPTRAVIRQTPTLPITLTLTLVFLSLSACAKRADPPLASASPGPRYYIVGRNPTQTLGRDPRKLLPGFGVVIVEQERQAGELVGRTSLGREIRMKDLRPATPSRFAGVHLQDQILDFGWVIREGAPIYAQPDTASKTLGRRAHYARLTLASHDGPQGFYRLADGWMSETDLRVPRLFPRPPVVAANESWIDVDLGSQTLIAYTGDKPVFATLVATGVGAEGTPFATPKGIHRIRAKLLDATMDNLSHTGVVPYSYEEVPFTQYIGRVALHGAFWHDQFGAPRSHGCINLSLADAEWLFAFTQPTLPEAEREIAATDRRPGSVVRVR